MEAVLEGGVVVGDSEEGYGCKEKSKYKDMKENLRQLPLGKAGRRKPDKRSEA